MTETLENLKAQFHADREHEKALLERVFHCDIIEHVEPRPLSERDLFLRVMKVKS